MLSKKAPKVVAKPMVITDIYHAATPHRLRDFHHHRHRHHR